jgi:hypothetical protein
MNCLSHQVTSVSSYVFKDKSTQLEVKLIHGAGQNMSGQGAHLKTKERSYANGELLFFFTHVVININEQLQKKKKNSRVLFFRCCAQLVWWLTCPSALLAPTTTTQQLGMSLGRGMK